MSKIFFLIIVFLCYFSGSQCQPTENSDNRPRVKRSSAGQGFIPLDLDPEAKETLEEKPTKLRKPVFLTNLPLVQISNKYYYFETAQNVNWFEAFTFCKRNHMDLLSIETKEENDLINKYLFEKLPNMTSVWTSGSDLAKEGSFIWMSTGMPITFTNWHPIHVIEPNNYNNEEHCIHIYQYHNKVETLNWNDWNCKIHAKFICETEPTEEFCDCDDINNEIFPSPK